MAAHVNGNVPQSAVVHHLLEYPTKSDSVNLVKDNKFGKMGIGLSTSAYQTFAEPILPYFARPYEYVRPYVQRVDGLGDRTLGKLDETFPVVRKPTAEVYADAKSAVTYPYRKAGEGKNHLLGVYNGERQQAGGGILGFYKAVITTGLVVASETLQAAHQIIVSTGHQAVEVVDKAT